MKNLSLLLLSFLFLACGDGGAEKPEKLLSEKDMENVLYDLAVLQAMRSYTPYSLSKHNINVKEYIYKKYDIDSASLAQNHRYYATDLEKYEGLQKKVAERLKKEKEKWQKDKTTDPGKKSSKRGTSTPIKPLGTGKATMTQDNVNQNPAH